MFVLYFIAPNMQASNNDGGMTMMYVMMAWIVAAVLLYLLRYEDILANVSHMKLTHFAV